MGSEDGEGGKGLGSSPGECSTGLGCCVLREVGGGSRGGERARETAPEPAGVRAQPPNGEEPAALQGKLTPRPPEP